MSATVELLPTPEVADAIGSDLHPLQRLADQELGALATELGVPAPTVTVDRCGTRTPFAITVDGLEEPYSLALMRCMWRRAVPRELADLILSSQSSTETAEQVLERYVTSPAADSAALTRFLVELARETLRLSPAALISPRREAARPAAASPAPHEHTPANAMFGDLLALGISQVDRSAVGRLLDTTVAAGCTEEEAVEEAFARLSLRQVEVRVNSALWSALAQEGAATPLPIDHDSAVQDLRAGGLVVHQRLRDLGVNRPIVLVMDPAVTPTCIRVRVNDRLGAELPVACAGELAVQLSPHKLRAAGLESRALIDPASGHRVSAIAAELAADVERLGVVPLTPAAYVAVAIGRELGPLAYRLLCVDEIERDLADLEVTHPSLVQAAMRVFSSGRLTRVLRRLLEEQISVRDTWRLLNVLLAFEVITLDDRDVHVFDDRLPVAEPSVDLDSASVEQLVAFARLRMPDRVSFDCGLRSVEPADELAMFMTDSEIERSVRSAGSLEQELGRCVRDSVAHALGRWGAPADPVIVTSPAVRARLRSILAAEFPSVRVVARNELPPEIGLRGAHAITLVAA